MMHNAKKIRKKGYEKKHEEIIKKQILKPKRKKKLYG